MRLRVNREYWVTKRRLKSVLIVLGFSSSKLLPAEGARIVFLCPLLEAVAMEGMPAVEVMHHRLYNR
jgi:hypothetical protein